uniref:Uncharacterized protein n=1 Tax=Lactuca sativa TaxID=4236 RepID=A0A9R1XF70_LACSA|nr:hypothetical protein LSAT_V11C400201040 [Lactuca sativa]
MKQTVKVAKFGSVIPISRSDFVCELSQAPSDVWVVVILYKDGSNAVCGKPTTTYSATKFVKIISTDCTPNYLDCNLPTEYCFLGLLGRHLLPKHLQMKQELTSSAKIDDA